MKRRAFLAGMVAAPIAAQLPPVPVTPSLLSVPDGVIVTAKVQAIANQILTSDMIAREAVRLLHNNVVYQRLLDADADET